LATTKPSGAPCSRRDDGSSRPWPSRLRRHAPASRVEGLAGEAALNIARNGTRLPRKREPPAQRVADLIRMNGNHTTSKHAPRQARTRRNTPFGRAARAPACGACRDCGARRRVRSSGESSHTRARGGRGAARRVDRGDRGPTPFLLRALDVGRRRSSTARQRRVPTRAATPRCGVIASTA